MRNLERIFELPRARAWMERAAAVGLIALSFSFGVKLYARPQPEVRAVTNQVTYNVGEAVELRLIPPAAEALRPLASYRFTIRFAGNNPPVADRLNLGNEFLGYRLLWKVPANAQLGRYEVDVRVQDPSSRQVLQETPHLCSFVVHRQVVRILSADVRQSNYSAGDAVGCSIQMQNLSAQPLNGLRLEFSERYWPWIAQQTQKVGTAIHTLGDGITLKARQPPFEVTSSTCASAPEVKEPTIKQYAAVLWDHDRKNVLAIAFTPLVFIDPPGVRAPRPYPPQFIYPDLSAVNTTSYRHFHPEPFGASAIQFDTTHTQFASGSEAVVKFTLANPTPTSWRQVRVLTGLLSPEGKDLANGPRISPVDIEPHGSALHEQANFQLPAGASGLYRVKVELADASGQILASNELELGVNPLPGSVLMFCAHQDDDGTQMGFIRSLVENGIPFHLVYYTSGDAGSCDRYFQHSCGPADALNFGAVRMQEARAAMGHLGVPAQNIYFLGLPDGGSGKIWYHHLPASRPYLAVQLASDHAPYAGLFQPNLPYARDAVEEAAEDIIRKLQPAVVFTNHPPAEGHIDHIVNNYFTVKALQELLRAGAVSPDLEVRVDGIFNPKGYPATPYHYEDHQFYVSAEVMARVQEAGWFYQSQGGNNAEGNLRTWNQLRQSEAYRKVLDWKEHEGWNEKE